MTTHDLDLPVAILFPGTMLQMDQIPWHI